MIPSLKLSIKEGILFKRTMDNTPSYKRSLRMSAPLLGVLALGILGLTTVSAAVDPEVKYAGDAAGTVSYTHLTLPTICSV